MNLTDKCALCKKQRGWHHSITKACPMGMKGRADTYSFHPTNVFKLATPRGGE